MKTSPKEDPQHLNTGSQPLQALFSSLGLRPKRRPIPEVKLQRGEHYMERSPREDSST